MVWKSKSQIPVEAKSSTFSQLLPLVILLVVLGGGALVGYQIYLSASKIRADAEKKFAKKNVVFTKDGLKVGVKHVEQERYVDATQSWVVKAWNMAGSKPAANNSSSSAATKRK